jgi:hypothetical protein
MGGIVPRAVDDENGRLLGSHLFMEDGLGPKLEQGSALTCLTSFIREGRGCSYVLTVTQGPTKQ